MLKKHLTILLLLVMAVGAFAQSIPSGTARYEALGYNPFIMDAATDINRNPAWGGMYRNYTFGDIGRGSVGELELTQQYAGVNFGLGKNFSAGMVLNKEEGEIFGGEFYSYYNNLGISSPIVPFKGLIAYTATNKKLHIGLAPYFAMWSKKSTSGTLDTTWNSMILGGTVGVYSKMKKGWVEGAVDVKLDKYKYERTDTVAANNLTNETSGGLELSAFLRAFFEVYKPSKINLVPYVAFKMFNWEPKITQTPALTQADEYKFLSISGGVGINMPVLDDGMLAGGLSVAYNSAEHNTSDTNYTDNTKVTEFVLPRFNLGLEWSFTDWLSGRAGYSRSVTSEKTTREYTAGSVSTTAEVTQLLASDPVETVTLGLGLHFGRFSFDGLIGERVFKHGTYLLSGYQDDLYAVISASYNFNK
jgi:hypothetical protein